jgi:hypothetical protein
VTLAVAPVTSELVALLAEELALYDELLFMARREHESVLGNDPAVLERIVAEKETLIARVGRVEARRQQWVADWAVAAGLDPAGLTLSELAARLPAEAAAELDAAGGALLARVRELAELGFRNRSLVASALGVVSRRLAAYNRVTTALGYRATGATVKGAAAAQLDLRA